MCEECLNFQYVPPAGGGESERYVEMEHVRDGWRGRVSGLSGLTLEWMDHCGVRGELGALGDESVSSKES